MHTNGTLPRQRRRKPPANIEAEHALLASVLLDPAASIHLVGVPSDAFHEPQAFAVASAIHSLISRGKPVDPTLIRDELGDAAEFRDETVAAYLAGLLEQAATAANAEHYAKLVRDAWLRRRAMLSFETGLEHLSDPTDDVAGILSRARSDVDAIIGGGADERFRIESISTLDLLESPRPSFIVEGVLVDGQPGVIGGAFKTMKTSVAVDLAVSIATGGHFLGYFRVPEPRRVGMVSGESGRHTLAETCDRVSTAAGVDPRFDLDNLIWSTTIPALTEPEHLEALRRFICQHELAVLVADPWYLMAGAAADNAANVYAMGQVYANLGRIGQDTGCTIIALHHTSRGASRDRAYRPVELGDLAFAGVAEHARQWLLLGRRAPYCPSSGVHELWLSVGGSAGHGGIWAVDIDEGVQSAEFDSRHWRTTVRRQEDADKALVVAKERMADQQREERLERTRSDVVGVLVKLPGNRGTKSQIRSRIACSWPRIEEAVASLLDDGTIAECDLKGANKRSYHGYQLTDSEG